MGNPAQTFIADEEEKRLRERLKQRQFDRRKSKEEANLASEVSNKASDDATKMPEPSTNKNSGSSVKNSTGSPRQVEMNKRREEDNSRKRSHSTDRGSERKTNGDAAPGRRKRKRRRAGRRRRPRREEPGDFYRDNRDYYNPQPYLPPREGPYPMRGGVGGGYDRYPYDYPDRRPPRDRYERPDHFRGRPFGPDQRYGRDERFDNMRERGRERGRSRSRSLSGDSYSRSGSSSRSRSRSYSRSNSMERSRDNSGRDDGSRTRAGKKKRSPSVSDASADSHSTNGEKVAGDALTKDQRTVFVSQLVMRANESDIRRYFKKKGKCKVNDVIFLKDRRTGRHKGSAYVELAKLEHVPIAVKLSGVVPDFQRFPILIKGSDAEKNYEPDMYLTSDILSNAGMLSDITNIQSSNGLEESDLSNSLTGSGKKIEIQNVYVGSIDRCVTQAQLYALFSQFGTLDKVSLQIDTTTGLSRGFAFLSYRSGKDANLAIQTMSGQQLAGRALKTGWANQPSAPGVEAVTSDEFPEDSAEKIQKAHNVLTQLTGAGLVAFASLGLQTGVTVNSETGENTSNEVPLPLPEDTLKEEVVPAKDVSGILSSTILVHNMYDKDEETDELWYEDIKEEFIEESSKYGSIAKGANGESLVRVQHEKPGGMVYAKFETVEAAKSCAEALAGRFFDKRQIRVEYVQDFPTN